MTTTPAIGIFSASRLSVSDAATTLPSMTTTITGWFRPLVLGRIQSQVVEGEVEETVREYRCLGVIQPFGPRELRLKPEGQRAWNWQMLHTAPNVDLRDGEEFNIKDTHYRVMSQQKWAEYGYILYELVQDFDPRT